MPNGIEGNKGKLDWKWWIAILLGGGGLIWFLGSLLIRDEVNKYVVAEPFKEKVLSSISKNVIVKDDLIREILKNIEYKESIYGKKIPEWKNLSWCEKINFAFEKYSDDYRTQKKVEDDLGKGNDYGQK